MLQPLSADDREEPGVFAAKTMRGWDLERRPVTTFPPDFLLNRVPGPRGSGAARFSPSEVQRQALVTEPDSLTLPISGIGPD
ncbi:hypothetical protein DC347_17895 [Pseudarthrobacter sp. AG30]|nr:hypothetical protein DC347_17895 [Pseudarthrobacter sp. AG30]